MDASAFIEDFAEKAISAAYKKSMEMYNDAWEHLILMCT